MVIGAFTSENNQADGKFGVQPVKGEEITLEYYEPLNVQGKGELSIAEVIHAYRDLFIAEAYGYGNSLSCHINVNCAIGASWQNQKRAVALIVAGGGLCSGAMINNTAEDGKPYLLTASHCFSGSVSTWVYVFNYESPNCTNIEGPTNNTVSGSTLRAKYDDSDVLLVELNTLPPASYNVHYAGWSNVAAAPTSLGAIHHPAGDIKKISTEAAAPITTDWNGSGIFNHWEINGWDNGTTEGGSSGSPLFDQNGRIVGQLHGGSTPACPGTGKRSLYGKFSASWNTGATAAERLRDWLDPANTGATTLNGKDLSTLLTYCISSATTTGGGLVSNVSFGSIANNSGASCSMYSDFTSTTTNVTPGASVPLSITTGNCGTNTTRFVKVFIDWNADFDFADFGELVATSGAISDNTPFLTNVSVPGSTVVGSSPRMRIVCVDAASASSVNACGTYTTGETEDYTINVTAGTSYNLPLSGSSNITTCSGVLHDNGGAAGSYSSNCNGSITINPSVAGNKVSLTFTSFSLEDCCDMLFIYNGVNTSAPLIGLYQANSPGTVYATGATGALTVLFVSDGTVEYSGFQANIACVASLPQADLITQTQLATPASASPGGTISASCNIYNQGGSSATSSAVGYYLSTDNAWDAGDVLVGSSTGGTLAVSAASAKTATLNIPGGTALGNYFIIYYADHLNAVIEDNETNNTTSYAITIVAPSVDLVIQTPSATPTTLIAGSSVSLSCMIANQGTTVSTFSNVGYYISADNVWDAGDVLLGNSAGGTLNNAASASRSATLTIPGGTTPGNYFILYFADYNAQVGETNETNNVASLAVTVPNSYLVPFSTTTSVTTCSGSVYDHAGAGSYSNSASGTLTINPSVAGNYVQLNFVFLSVESCCDRLYIYDGTSTAAPLIGTYTSNPGVVFATNVSGALTLRFTSDGSVVSNGFEAAISCLTSVPRPDLVVQTPAVTPLAIGQGGIASLSSTVQNSGTATATSSNMAYYLSTDAVWDAADTYLGLSSGGSLIASSTSLRNSNVTIPVATPLGSYYILFFVDYLNGVNEDNETNNVNSVSISVVAPTIDLIIQTPVLVTSSVPAGGPTNVTCYIYNQGNVSSPSSNVGYYLSTDAVYDGSDVYLNYSFGGTLAASVSSLRSATLTIPGATTPGSYYILYFADYSASVTEVNETNNVVSLPITIVTPTIDLQITTPTLVASSVSAGASVNANCYINNSGNLSATSSNVGYYLSVDAVWDAADVYLTYTAGGSLAPSISSYRSATLTIPSATTPGSYYILYFADYSGSVTEVNETNNVANLPITITASVVDLIIQTPSLSNASTFAGSSISAYGYITNQGTSPATSSNIGYYLSTNTTWDAGDTYLTASTGSTLNGSGSSYRSVTLTIPGGTAAGTYYILYFADYSGSVTEVNETNNVNALTLTITNGYVVPFTGTNSITTCSGTVYDHAGTSNYSNSANGTMTINPATVGNYVQLNFSSFSVESCCDRLYIYDGTNTSAPLIGTYTSSPGIVSASSASGALTLRFTSDGSVVYSGFEATVSCITTPPLPDLIIQSPSFSSSSVSVGNSIIAYGYIANQGSAIATTSNIGYYLSTNAVWDAGDTYLTASTGSALSASGSSYRSVSLSIPGAIAPGSYYILYFADYSGSVNETNETNNVSGLPITVTASVVDLIIQTPSLSASSASAGGSINAFCYITNQGTSSATSSAIGYYLSSNTTWDAGDIYLAGSTGVALGASSTSYRSYNITIPGGTVAGTYYVIYFADYAAAVTESNETNNVNYQMLTIVNSYAMPFSSTTSISTCSGIVYDHAGTSNYSNSANGTMTINPATVGNYVQLSFTSFSVETCCDRLYIYDGTNTSAPLIGAFTSNPGVVVATTASGALTLVFTSDGSIVSSGFEATLSCINPTPDLTILNPMVNNSIIPAGSNVTVDCDVYNISSLYNAGASYVGYYLSTNATLGASDILLSTSYINNVNASDFVHTSANNLHIPIQTLGGSYYIIFYADYNNGIVESDETNNTYAVPVSLLTDLEAKVDISEAISVYPNPSIGRFSVSIDKAVDSYKITVLNTLGEEILSRNAESSPNGVEEHFQLTNEAAGLYTVKIEVGERVWYKKVAIEK